MLNQETVSTTPRSGDSDISHSRSSVGLALLLSGTVLLRGVQAHTPVEWACPDYPNLFLNRSFEGKAHRRHDNPSQWHVGGGAAWSREAARSGDAAVRFLGPGWAGQWMQLLPEIASLAKNVPRSSSCAGSPTGFTAFASAQTRSRANSVRGP